MSARGRGAGWRRRSQSWVRAEEGSSAKTIGVVVPDIANPFFTLVVRGAEDVAWSNGRQVILCNSQGDLERERRHLDDLVASGVEGVLIAPVSDRSVHGCGRSGSTSSRSFSSTARSRYDGDLVQGDSVAGARALVAHLVSLGHRRIGIVAEPTDVSTSRDRILGYREALEAAGVEAARAGRGLGSDRLP